VWYVPNDTSFEFFPREMLGLGSDVKYRVFGGSTMTPIEDCLRSDDGSCFHRKSRQGSLLKKLGPGFVTGASDDDPSGLATFCG
jgi:hypothetical protein